ncbi:translesion DNA synthesis-associated protein ImuA [Undibacterium sp.]|uniref:translesion DNA synthesis-associated protein ImuA n=1 Tax=Undibacterium sp. TaxID=1914977 RepID=UPI0025F92E37|nr:translesion DNA synthesis-associated protein ImuA [Undibacterium sp.]
MKSSPHPAPESIHPSLWRASQLARAHGDYVACGYSDLAAELPGAGWPMGALSEILIQHPGTAELALLQPALAGLQRGHIILLEPPYQPQALGLAELGLDISRILWLRSKTHSDALWSAEQILRSASCAALLFWPSQIRSENLRRLHLAAQSGNTLFTVIRAQQQALNPSPAPLRLKLQRVALGLQVEIIKRRGTQAHAPLIIPQARLAAMYRARPDTTIYEHEHVEHPLISDNSVASNLTNNITSRTQAARVVAGRASTLAQHRSFPAELAG